MNPIKPADLTQDDLDLMAEILNDYLDTFDEEEEQFSGVEDPQARHDSAESLLFRLLGIDPEAIEAPQHHPDCTCDWCELNRGS